ncbi:hypothetical protein [Metamycoplasma equirhinis]|uniref:Protein kinase domain-containing protein n=1 Tax=Metamycoplasma equirhinis TaxID=92402 RepID=A0ABZ0PBA8_9BACT|nr:hypothetical protein [Metamycoplasma equirhinis]TPD99613.1 hypothetical protein FJM08_00355 [Metamycoplasma equirhinis]WPB53935.1 hypothetical protein R9B83_03015 [Metamycoplasma equirhinis]BDX52974.1 hypothetical protein JPM7_5810 [Metamycoplasma equirhinis]
MPNKKNFSVQQSNQRKKNTEIFEVYELIKNNFGMNVFEKFSHIRFYYEDFHNKSYIGKLESTWVQIRVPKNIIKIDHSNETKVVSTFKDYLYVKDGIIVKKWFPGVDLFKIKIDAKISNAILNCIRNFQNILVNVTKFNWLKYDIKDKKYLHLVKKYENDELVLSHNNLKRQNILVNKYGFIKLVDFEFAALNSRYVDPVSLYLFLGVEKKLIIDFFNLDEEKFDDFAYMLRIFNETSYKQTYANIKAPNNMLSESLSQYNNKDFSIPNRFIVQKFHNQFDNRLDTKIVQDFYFVPICVYEDNDRIIWRWLNCKPTTEINARQIKVLAKAMRTYHDSDKKFPSYILRTKIDWYLQTIDKKILYEDIQDKKMIDEIYQWIKEIKPDANCHNNLNLDNIFFTDKLNLYIIDWAIAYRNCRFLDIAFMFENTHIAKNIENVFWKAYDIPQPKDFYKYRIIIHFTSYLYNRILNGDYVEAGINITRIMELWKEYKE